MNLPLFEFIYSLRNFYSNTQFLIEIIQYEIIIEIHDFNRNYSKRNFIQSTIMSSKMRATQKKSKTIRH